MTASDAAKKIRSYLAAVDSFNSDTCAPCSSQDICSHVQKIVAQVCNCSERTKLNEQLTFVVLRNPASDEWEETWNDAGL